jgi:hypothetical protein
VANVWNNFHVIRYLMSKKEGGSLMGGSPFFVLFDVDIPSLLDLSHAGCGMDDVQHLDPVDDKV